MNRCTRILVQKEHRGSGKFSGNNAPLPQQTELIWTMPWDCWAELDDKGLHCKEWECIIETSQRSGHHSALNLWSACNTHRWLQAGRLGQCTSLDIENGIRLASGRNSRGSAAYEQVRSRVTRSGHSAPQVDTLGSISSGANATVVVSVVSWADYGHWDQKGLSSLSAFQITETKEGGMMVITTTRVTQMHDIVNTLQDGPESVKEILWSGGPWLGKELVKAWENYYKVQGYSPFATCGNGQCRSKDLCVLTSAALPSTRPSFPLNAPSNSRYWLIRADVKWRLLLLLLVKKQCSSFVWNSKGTVFYAQGCERLWFADCRHIFYFSQKKRHLKGKSS